MKVPDIVKDLIDDNSNKDIDFEKGKYIYKMYNNYITNLSIS